MTKKKQKSLSLEQELAYTGELGMRSEGKPIRVQLKGEYKPNPITKVLEQEVVAEQIVIIPHRYKPGHVCTAEGANALQQHYTNSVGNWMRLEGQKYMKEALAEGRQIGEVVLQYAADYQFGGGSKAFRTKLRLFAKSVVLEEYTKSHPTLTQNQICKLPEFKAAVNKLMNDPQMRKKFGALK